ncbi:MAG: hypothetical protein R3A47_09060 [Polyangiales bacterium]
MQLSFEFLRGQPDVSPPPRPKPDPIERAYDQATRWSRTLAARMGEPVRLVITDNRRTVLSSQRREGRLQIRLHHMFLDADENVLNAVADYVAKQDSKSGKTIDAFIESHKGRVIASARRRTALNPEGACFHLGEIFNDLSARYFSRPLEASITWGRRAKPKRGQRSLQLGNYVPEEQLIRINPVLDQPWVPRFVVEGVVYHEMLHHDMPAVVRNGRHHFHTDAFRKRELMFERFAEAEAWEKENLWRLMRKR